MHKRAVLLQRAERYPSAAGASPENISVKSFDLRYDDSGKFEGGTVTVWRYNGTFATEDFWTQGIITLSADGSVTFKVEHEEIVLLSEYNPARDRSLIPITEKFEQVERADISISAGSYISDSAECYRLTHHDEELVEYVACSASGVRYYDEFTQTDRPSELSSENYLVSGKYWFLLTSYSGVAEEPTDWVVFMFDK